MKIKMFTSLVAILALALVALPTSGVFAQTATTGASVSFSPAGGSIPAGQNFDIDVIVNTGGQNSAAADVTVRFDSTKLDFVGATYPDSTTFYPNNRVIFPIAATGNLIQMARTVSTPASGDVTYTNGSGVFAKLTFKTKATVAVGDTTTLSFDYTAGATNDFTNVANAVTPSTDLLGTSTLPTATYTVGGANPPVGTNPVITGIAPAAGSAKNTVEVTISGANFGTFVDGQSKVYLGTKVVTILSWTDTQIRIQVAAEPDLTQDSVRQVKVHRPDGLEATYLGYRLVASGPAAMLWGGVSLMAFGLSMVTYRRPKYGVVNSPTETSDTAQASATNSQIHYREVA